MQPAVLELVHDLERRQVERVELPHSAEVEQAVAVDRVRRPPDGGREERRRGRDARDRHALAVLGRQRRAEQSPERGRRPRSSRAARASSRSSRPPQRWGRQRSGESGQAPRERRGDRDTERVRPGRADEDPTRNEHDACRRGCEPQHEAHAVRRERPAQDEDRRSRRARVRGRAPTTRGGPHPRGRSAPAGSPQPLARLLRERAGLDAGSPRATDALHHAPIEPVPPGSRAESYCSECQRIATRRRSRRPSREAT